MIYPKTYISYINFQVLKLNNVNGIKFRNNLRSSPFNIPFFILFLYNFEKRSFFQYSLYFLNVSRNDVLVSEINLPRNEYFPSAYCWIYLFPGATRVPIANSIPFHSHRKCTHNTVRSFA